MFVWARILTFIFFPDNYSRKEKVRIIIENPYNFARIEPRSVKKLESEIRTIKFALENFREEFKKENLNDYIDTLNSFGEVYLNNPEVEKKRVRLIELFQDMLKILESEQVQSSFQY